MPKRENDCPDHTWFLHWVYFKSFITDYCDAEQIKKKFFFKQFQRLFFRNPVGLMHKHNLRNSVKLRMKSFCSVEEALFTGEPCLICDPFVLAQFLLSCSFKPSLSRIWFGSSSITPTFPNTQAHTSFLSSSVSLLLFCPLLCILMHVHTYIAHTYTIDVHMQRVPWKQY